MSETDVLIQNINIAIKYLKPIKFKLEKIEDITYLIILTDLDTDEAIKMLGKCDKEYYDTYGDNNILLDVNLIGDLLDNKVINKKEGI